MSEFRPIVVLFYIFGFSHSLLSYQTADESDEFEALLEVAMALDDLDSQMVMLDSLYNMSVLSNNIEDVGVALIFKGYNYHTRGILDKSIEHFLLFLELIGKTQKPDWVDEWNKITAYNNIGIVLVSVKEYATAKKYYDSAAMVCQRLLSISETAQDIKDASIVLNDVKYSSFLAFKNASDDLNAVRERAFDLIEEFERKNCINKLDVLNDLGLLEKGAGNYEDSRGFFREILTDSCAQRRIKAIALHNMGLTFSEQGDYNSSLVYLDSALQIKTHSGSKESNFISLLDRGEVFFKLGDYKLAIKDWESALALGFNISHEPDLFLIYEFLAEVNHQMGNKEAQVSYQRLFETFQSNYKESADGIKRRDQIETIRSILASQERVSLKRRLSKDYFIFGTAVIVVVIFLVLLVLKKRRDKKRKLLFNKLGDILINEESNPH